MKLTKNSENKYLGKADTYKQVSSKFDTKKRNKFLSKSLEV